MAGPTEEAGSPAPQPRWVERWWGGELGWRGHLLDLALAPAELLFRGAVLLRGAAYDRSAFRIANVPVPIISVGNLSVGGSGKTPISRWLVSELLRRGESPAVLHGGYALDEPELHRRWHPGVPVLVGRDRAALAESALEAGATVVVLDDGFQHRRLARDLDLVLVAAEGWNGRPRLLPRGPWREGPRALGRAQVAIVTRKTASHGEAAAVRSEIAEFLGPDSVAAQAWLRPAGWRQVADLADNEVDGRGQVPEGSVVAVTAIARPELFVENAVSAGANVSESLFFPDHHDFTSSDLDRIRQLAAGRPIVTTAKDMVKLSVLDPTLWLWVLEQEVELEAGARELGDAISSILQPQAGGGTG